MEDHVTTLCQVHAIHGITGFVHGVPTQRTGGGNHAHSHEPCVWDITPRGNSFVTSREEQVSQRQALSP